MGPRLCPNKCPALLSGPLVVILVRHDIPLAIPLQPSAGGTAAIVVVNGPGPAIVIPVANFAIGYVARVGAFRTDLAVFVPLDVRSLALAFDRGDFHLLLPVLVIRSLLAVQLAAAIVVLGSKHMRWDSVRRLGLLLVAHWTLCFGLAC